MKQLTGRHALVTGANRGIGASIVRHLAEAGANVSLMVRTASSADALVRELGSAGTRTAVVVADVTDRAAVQQACAGAAAALGPVDILVNNAGTAETVPFLKSEPALFEQMIAMHLMGPVAAAQAVLPSMIERQQGRIVNVASVAGLFGATYISAYCSAKHALVGLTRALAVEFAPKGVLVNAVCPGYTDTDLVSGAVTRIVAKTGRSAEEAMAMILLDAGQRRMVTVEEVARAVLAYSLPSCTASGEALPIVGEAA